MTQPRLQPFWNYYGGKSKAANHYPVPRYDTIVEPFSGAAGYALRYYNRNVILIEKDPKVASIWKYLIETPSEEIMKLPLVEDVADLAGDVAEGARHLIGFNMNTAVATPGKTLSTSHRDNRAINNYFSGWGGPHRALCAVQAEFIRHWKIIEGDYTEAPNVEATWFIDPPYRGIAGEQYKFNKINYEALSTWCKARQGQVMVCENEGARWLPFEPWFALKPSINKGPKMKDERSREVMWTNDPEFDVSVLPSGRLRVRL